MVTDINSKELGSYFKNNERYLEIWWQTGSNPGILYSKKVGTLHMRKPESHVNYHYNVECIYFLDTY